MNAIRNYLDNMFRNLPNTEEVRRAKTELLEMMEDKYEELIKEGKTENEAVGIVISEFGNLDELAESLGISEAVAENPDEDKPMLSLDRVKEYLSMMSQYSMLVPLAIGLCIFSVAFNIIADAIPGFPEFFGVVCMFLSIGVAVGLFIYEGIRKNVYKEIYAKECSLSIESAEYVRSVRKNYKSTYALMSSFGICLCILSILNPMIIGSIPFINDNFGAVLFFLFNALGVFLITSANIRMSGYDRLLELNEAGKMSEEFVPKSDRKVNKTPIIICAVVALCVAFTFGGISVVKTLMSGVFIKSDYVSETMSTTYDEIAENSGEELKTVKVDAEALEVIIKRGEGEGLISVDYSGPVNIKPEVTFENGKLVVKQRGKGFNISANNFNGPSLEIVIGEDVQIEDFEMKINAGNIKINGVTIDYVYGEIDAGNIEINDCTLKKVDFDIDAGNYNIKDSEIGKLNIDTDAGNIEIKDTKLTDVEITADFGSVDIEGLDDIDSYEIECDVDAGVISVGSTETVGHYKLQGSGDGTIKISVDAGNIEIDD